MWTFCDHTYSNRLVMGTDLYSSPEVMCESLEAAGAELVVVDTVNTTKTGRDASGFNALIMELGVDLLPSTAGCRSAEDAIRAASDARSRFDTKQVLLDIHGDETTCFPDHAAILDAAKTLLDQGFDVFPCVANDLVVIRRLIDAGVHVVLPSGFQPGSGDRCFSPIGLRQLRQRFPKTTFIVHGSISRPSEASLIMELGLDGVFVNRPIALARDPIGMAEAFADAVVAGRLAFEAGLDQMTGDSSGASHPAPPFWHIVSD